MPKVLTEAQIRAFETQGFLSPVRVMSTERARSYRERFESLEARHEPDIKKMKTKGVIYNSDSLCEVGTGMYEDIDKIPNPYAGIGVGAVTLCCIVRYYMNNRSTAIISCSRYKSQSC